MLLYEHPRVQRVGIHPAPYLAVCRLPFAVMLEAEDPVFFGRFSLSVGEALSRHQSNGQD